MVAQPRFFIVRPDTKHTAADGRTYTRPGPIVPLVAVDELPEWLDIPDAPRQLSVEQTVGLCNLGVASRSKYAYPVKIIHHATPAARQKAAVAKNAEAKPSNGATADAAARYSSPISASASHESKGTTTPTPTPEDHPADHIKAHPNDAHTGARAGTITASEHNPQQPHPPQTQPTPSAIINTSTTPTNSTTTTTTSSSTTNNPDTPSSARTEYCRHWCHYGTCKFGLRCRYLHAMPETAAELAAVGLRKIPAWWWVATAPGAGVGPGHALGVHSHQHQHHQQHHQQNLQHPQQQHTTQQPPHLTDTHHNHHNHHSHTNHTNHTNPIPGPAVGNTSTLDSRDVRLGVARRRGLLPHSQAHAHAHDHTQAEEITGGGAAAAGGGSAMSNRAMRAQLQEAMALLRELGLGGGGGGGGTGCGGGGGGGNYARPRRRGMNPLQRLRGRPVVGKGVPLRGPAVDAAAVVAATATAAAGGGGGQMQSEGGLAAIPESVLDNVVEGEGEDGRVACGAVQPVGTEKVEKLVDV
ncbi:uncharacterized protein B0H64DRAFT_437273 [Chaetomium fimeti]|uniref:C3H1-type domain-containing protein n=1 Tax=Chaetomium fimeti TaxID=1854472 RepID=A0AAE0HPM5_9PEZI|nr:hypothetical protein B0H64DRAFT_437273 [Chaetomium fimeti]